MTDAEMVTDRDLGDEAPENCGADSVALYPSTARGRVVYCERPRGHEGNHRAQTGQIETWNWPQEINSIDQEEGR